MPRRVSIAFLLAILGHGFFIVTARYRLSYDAYNHMLFANHYAENWFSIWEPRWYRIIILENVNLPITPARDKPRWEYAHNLCYAMQAILHKAVT